MRKAFSPQLLRARFRYTATSTTPSATTAAYATFSSHTEGISGAFDKSSGSLIARRAAS